MEFRLRERVGESQWMAWLPRSTSAPAGKWGGCCSSFPSSRNENEFMSLPSSRYIWTSGGVERHQFEPGRTVLLHVTRIQNLPVNSSLSLLIYWVSCSMMISWVTIKLKSCCIILHHIYVIVIDWNAIHSLPCLCWILKEWKIHFHPNRQDPIVSDEWKPLTGMNYIEN